MDDELVDRFLLENEMFKGPDTFNWNEKISMGLSPDLEIPLWEIFEKTLPKIFLLCLLGAFAVKELVRKNKVIHPSGREVTQNPKRGSSHPVGFRSWR